MMTRYVLRSAAIASCGLAVFLSGAAGAASHPDSRGRAAAGQQQPEAAPLITPEERALIRRKCGNGRAGNDSIIINDGVLHCADGRRIDDPEVRAMMAVAGPRIRRSVEALVSKIDMDAIDEAVAQAKETMRRLGIGRQDAAR